MKMKPLLLGDLPRWARGATIAAALTMGIGLACAEQDPDSADLATVEVPEGFDFATSRAVSLHIAATEVSGILEVSDLGDGVIYRGPLMPDRPVLVAASIPTAARALHVAVFPPDREPTVVMVPVEDGVVRHSF